MKDGIDASQDVYSLINVSEVTSLLDGRVYLFERPEKSTKRDIVIGTLALTNNQMQKGVVNVNIHCPNISGLTIDDKTDNTQPDIESLNSISKVVLHIVANYYGNNFTIDAQTPSIPVRDTVNGTWFVNIRVNYYSLQGNYANI